MEIVATKIGSMFIKICVLILLNVFSLTMVLSPNLSFAMGSKNRPQGKGLYFYSARDLSRFLEKIGYPGFPIKASWGVSRNSDGTALRFFDWSNNKAVVVSCDGLVKPVDLPGKATWSRRPLWFNDVHQVVAWLGEDGMLHKAGEGGTTEFKTSALYEEYGKYFIKDIPSAANKDIPIGTAIYSIERPDVPLSKVHILGERIFVKDDKVHLFGTNFSDRDEQEKLYIFQKKGSELIEIEKVVISRPSKSPAPFNVEDLSPWSDEVLFCDVHDFPSRSRWYVFDLKTHEMKKIGKKPFSGGWGFYLQCDIIREVTKKIE